jgi:hypothetical protein
METWMLTKYEMAATADSPAVVKPAISTACQDFIIFSFPCNCLFIDTYLLARLELYKIVMAFNY